MKFTDGNWLIKEGFQIHSPHEVHSAEIHKNALEIFAPCRHIAHRGATLEGPLLTIRLSSPIPDVVRVQVSHFQGIKKRGPRFAVNCDANTECLIADEGDFFTFQSGDLTARINKETWGMGFFSGNRRITGTGFRGIGYVKQTNTGQTYMKEQLDLGVGECVYGLGERFTAFVKNGQVVNIWNKDGGTGSEQAYKSVPFYLTNRGYGVFVNHPECVSFEVGSERVSKVQFSVEGESLDYFIINGPTPKKVLERYTALTGRPALPPAWSFGLWLTTSFTTDYDEETVNSFIDGMAERDLPLHVFHFDCFWMKEFQWCNFTWDEDVFPDPEAMLKRLHAQGLKTCVWINPYIGQRSPLFVEGKEKGYLLKRPNGDVWQWDLWQPGLAVVDFTN
ncbi:MAG: alpha-xylosidase, partial [Firmicutes bacterium]|nr:alpha-xylosidase [Bacillota bacterium]